MVGMVLGAVIATLAFWGSPPGLPGWAGAQEKPAGEAKRLQGVDRFGDPLPRGALVRLGTTRFRSPAPTFAAALSPDGKLAVTAPETNLIFWDTATGKELRRSRIPGATTCFSLAFSQDGKRVVAGDHGENATLWDAATGKLLQTFPSKERMALQVAISPDGKVVAATGPPTPPRGVEQPAGDPITLWDAETGQEIRRLPAPLQAYCMTFSPDGKFLASAHTVGWVLWEVATGAKIRLTPSTSFVYSVAFSPDGKSVATTAHDGVVRLWDVATGKQTAHFEDGAALAIGAIFSPDGKRLLSLGLGTLRLRELASGQVCWQLPRDPRYQQFVAVSGDFKTLLVGGMMVLAVGPLGGADPQLFSGHQEMVCKAAFSADGKTIHTFSPSERRDWDVASGKLLDHSEGKQDLTGYGERSITSADGKLQATWDLTRIQVRRVGADRVLHDWVPHQQFVTAADFSPDGRLLATTSLDQEIVLWEVATGKAVGRFDTPQGRINWLAFSPDSRKLASASVDTTVLIWDVTKAGK